MLAFSFEQEKPVIIRYAKSEGHRQRELPKANSLGIWEQLKLSNDICIIAYGRMVDGALDASDILSEDGIHAGVINASSIKPIDTSLINKLSSKISVHSGGRSAAFRRLEALRICHAGLIPKF